VKYTLLVNKSEEKSHIFEPPAQLVNIYENKHIIHQALLWQEMLDSGEMKSMAEIARENGLTRARVTQIMNLLKLPTKVQDFLVKLDNPKEIRKYSERKLREMNQLS